MFENNKNISKVSIINIGCKVNFAEASRLKEMLIENHFEIVENSNDADAILINTCSVTNHSEQESRQIIRRARKNNESAFIGVFGCYAQLRGDIILKETGANAVFGIKEKANIPQILSTINKNIIDNKIASNFDAGYIISNNEDIKFVLAYSADNDSRARAFLKLQDGCDFRCTYCTVPLARGKSCSMNFDEIPKILEHIVNVGYKEIVISGINLSDYHSNSGENFLDLLKFISSLQHINIFENIRFRISSIEPQIINEELISIIAGSCNICPHFHIPLQSGSNNVLKQMKRRYNVQQFRNSIEIINNFLPNAFIGLDVISGFPGETEVDFTETKEFISSLKISSLHCFTYSKRSGTPADTMPNQIPKSEKKHRTNQLIDISKNKLETFLRSNIGRELLLLPEKIIDISNQEILPENSYTFGHTENYIGLYVQSEKSLQNQLYKVKFTQIHNNKAIGELL